jgi:hypothetical protein
MTARVKLRDVIEAMEVPGDDWHSYLDPKTGEIVTLTGDGQLLGGDEDLEDVDPDDVPDRFLALPGRFEIHEWSIMERFAHARRNAGQREELLDSIHGSGAFRMFKSTIHRLGIEQDWYRFRDSEIEQIAKDWLQEHGIEYE